MYRFFPDLCIVFHNTHALQGHESAVWVAIHHLVTNLLHTLPYNTLLRLLLLWEVGSMYTWITAYDHQSVYACIGAYMRTYTRYNACAAVASIGWVHTDWVAPGAAASISAVMVRSVLLNCAWYHLHSVQPTIKSTTAHQPTCSTWVASAVASKLLICACV